MTALRLEDVPVGVDMQDTQGLRQFDPFRALQLQPRAPRDLVEVAYWTLASSRTPPLTPARIEELNAAYAAFLHADPLPAPQSAPTTNGASPPSLQPQRRGIRRLFAPRQAVAHEQQDHYSLLRLDRDADDRIIALAHEYWSTNVHSSRIDRALVEEAHRVLSQPQLRAQYDARLGAAPPNPSPGSVDRDEVSLSPKNTKIPKQFPSQIQKLSKNGENALETAPNSSISEAPRPLNGAALNGSAPSIAETPSPALKGSSRVQPVEPASEPGPSQNGAFPSNATRKISPIDVPPAAEPVPAPNIQEHPPLSAKQREQQLAEAQQDRLLQLRDEADAVNHMPSAPAASPHAESPSVELPSAEAATEEQAPAQQLSSPPAWMSSGAAATRPDEDRPVRRGLFGRRRPPAEPANAAPALLPPRGKQATVAALQGRVASLRSGAPGGLGYAVDPLVEHAAPAKALASLTFESGARAGETVGLDGEPAVIGSGPAADVSLPATKGVAAEHARIWRRGEHFAFKQIDGARATIGGEALPLDIVFLEDGDVIAIGEHRLTFAQPARPQSHQHPREMAAASVAASASSTPTEVL